MADEKALTYAVRWLVGEYIATLHSFGTDDFLKSDVDPFRFGFSVALWGEQTSIEREVEHKLAMKLENMLGEFHENYLGNAVHRPTGSRWERVAQGDISGVDIRNRQINAFLQIKSKHNSMNSSSSGKLAQELGQVQRRNPAASVGCGWVIASPRRSCIGESTIAAAADVHKGPKLYSFVTGNPTDMDEVVASFTRMVGEQLREADAIGVQAQAARRIFADLDGRARRQGTSIAGLLYALAVK